MMEKFNGILSVDPGVKATGIAIFEHKKLVHCDVVRPFVVLNQLKNLADIVENVAKQWEHHMGGLIHPEVLIVERPQIYQQAMLKGDPNDLIPLAVLAGMLWERFKPQNVILPLPKEWKGQVPKNIHIKKTIANLSKQEKDLMVDALLRVPEYLRHNGYDAIGLGRWYITR